MLASMRTSGIAAAGLALLAALSMPALAQKSGHFQGHAVLLNMKYSDMKAPDGHPYKTMFTGEQEGLIFHNGGGAALDRMLDRAHYIVQYVGDAGSSSGYCMKTFTTKDKHQLHARCDWKATATGSAGIVTLLGGTGPFAGIKGKGKFNFVAVNERVNWDDIEWEWELP
ncbi:MAG: hypothetical protein IT532_04895 [Burkholderiales bacterium]|nr:hypothetical protein [Burkholderiales bacterium]